MGRGGRGNLGWAALYRKIIYNSMGWRPCDVADLTLPQILLLLFNPARRPGSVPLHGKGDVQDFIRQIKGQRGGDKAG